MKRGLNGAVRALIVSLSVLAAQAALAQTADINVRLTGPATVTAGRDLLYTATVTNLGPNGHPNTNLLVFFGDAVDGEGAAFGNCTDGLDNDDDGAADTADQECRGGLVFVGDSSGSIGCTNAAAGFIACPYGTLEAGDSFTVHFKFRVSPDYLINAFDFTAIASALVNSTIDPDRSDNDATVETVVEEEADLVVSKFSEPRKIVQPGDLFVYTIWVDNYGPSTAREVVIRDSLLVSDAVTINSCAFSVSQGGGSITQFGCTTGAVVRTQFGTDAGTFATNFLEPNNPIGRSPDDSGRLRASFRITALRALDLTNTTRAVSSTFDPDLSNNSAVDYVSTVSVADLSITKSVDLTQAIPGMTYSYTLLVTNNGPLRARNVVVTDELPLGVQVQSVTADTPDFSFLPGIPGHPDAPLRIFLDTIENDWDDDSQSENPGEDTDREITVTVLVLPSALQCYPGGALVLNGASVRSETPDDDNSNNQAVAPLSLTSCADSDGGDIPGTAGTVTYYSDVLKTSADVCLSSKYLQESYCSGGKPVLRKYCCPCSAGACQLLPAKRGESARRKNEQRTKAQVRRAFKRAVSKLRKESRALAETLAPPA